MGKRRKRSISNERAEKAPTKSSLLDNIGFQSLASQLRFGDETDTEDSIEPANNEDQEAETEAEAVQSSLPVNGAEPTTMSTSTPSDRVKVSTKAKIQVRYLNNHLLHYGRGGFPIPSSIMLPELSTVKRRVHKGEALFIGKVPELPVSDEPLQSEASMSAASPSLSSQISSDIGAIDDRGTVQSRSKRKGGRPSGRQIRSQASHFMAFPFGEAQCQLGIRLIDSLEELYRKGLSKPKGDVHVVATFSSAIQQIRGQETSKGYVLLAVRDLNQVHFFRLQRLAHKSTLVSFYVDRNASFISSAKIQCQWIESITPGQNNIPTFQPAHVAINPYCEFDALILGDDNTLLHWSDIGKGSSSIGRSTVDVVFSGDKELSSYEKDKWKACEFGASFSSILLADEKCIMSFDLQTTKSETLFEIKPASQTSPATTTNAVQPNVICALVPTFEYHSFKFTFVTDRDIIVMDSRYPKQPIMMLKHFAFAFRRPTNAHAFIFPTGTTAGDNVILCTWSAHSKNAMLFTLPHYTSSLLAAQVANDQYLSYSSVGRLVQTSSTDINTLSVMAPSDFDRPSDDASGKLVLFTLSESGHICAGEIEADGGGNHDSSLWALESDRSTSTQPIDVPGEGRRGKALPKNKLQQFDFSTAISQALSQPPFRDDFLDQGDTLKFEPKSNREGPRLIADIAWSKKTAGIANGRPKDDEATDAHIQTVSVTNEIMPLSTETSTTVQETFENIDSDLHQLYSSRHDATADTDYKALSTEDAISDLAAIITAGCSWIPPLSDREEQSTQDSQSNHIDTAEFKFQHFRPSNPSSSAPFGLSEAAHILSDNWILGQDPDEYIYMNREDTEKAKEEKAAMERRAKRREKRRKHVSLSQLASGEDEYSLSQPPVLVSASQPPVLKSSSVNPALPGTPRQKKRPFVDENSPQKSPDHVDMALSQPVPGPFANRQRPKKKKRVSGF